MATPSVSVVIPAYKARQFLEECLESVGRQTQPPLEVLVVDDASPDPVDDIVAGFAARDGYPPICLLKHEDNRGQAAARNTGIKESSGEWLAFLDSDDIWAPNHLESVLGAIERGDADLGFCPVILFDEDPWNPRDVCIRPTTDDEVAMRPMALVNRCFIITSSTIVRASSLKVIGGFDERDEIRGVEDLDCFMRLLQAGRKFCMASEATLYYRKHPASATGVVGQLARQDVRVRSKHVKWIDGGFREKREIVVNSYWRAANELWSVQASDRWKWLLMAIINSMPTPWLGARRMYRFLKNRTPTREGT